MLVRTQQRKSLTALAGYTVVLAAALSASTAVATRTGVTCETLGNVLDMVTQACICQPCHLCEFKWFQGSCDFIERDGLDLSDGSDLDVDQPLLEPTDWFLTEKEITDARGGKARSDLAVYSSGNAVTTYTASKDFFDAAFKDLSATKEDDRVMLAAWSTDRIPLQPDVDSGKRSQFQDVVAGLVERGTSFNALVWSNVLEGQQNVDVRDGINDLPTSAVNDASALFLFDDRLSTVLSSHHQKTLILSSASASGDDDYPVAYVGGIDITSDRWDTKFHNASTVRDAADITRDYQGWVDGHLRIHGPAAKDVAANFLARWNSDFVPSTGKVDDLLDFENPDYDDLELLDHASSNTTASLGSQNVQIVRTFSCKYEHYEEFAPKGETSLFQARIKALKNAKNFIYIEDQYFVLVPELLEAILEVMPTIQRLIVVVQPPDSSTKVGGYEKYSFDMIAPIQQLYPNKLQLYTTKEERNLYIHSKIVIIDDVYLSLGSANWNRRSMTSDSEIGANVVDDETVDSPDGLTVLKTARDFRIRKFQEMTGLSYEELDAMPFIEAANQLDVAAADTSTILQSYGVEEQAYFAAFTDDVRQVVDPQDEC